MPKVPVPLSTSLKRVERALVATSAAVTRCPVRSVMICAVALTQWARLRLAGESGAMGGRRGDPMVGDERGLRGLLDMLQVAGFLSPDKGVHCGWSA